MDVLTEDHLCAPVHRETGVSVHRENLTHPHLHLPFLHNFERSKVFIKRTSFWLRNIFENWNDGKVVTISIFSYLLAIHGPHLSYEYYFLLIRVLFLCKHPFLRNLANVFHIKDIISSLKIPNGYETAPYHNVIRPTYIYWWKELK